jgi:hypothetical protein
VTAGAKLHPLNSFCWKELAVDELAVANLGARIELAHFRTKRVREFQQRFPPMQSDPAELLPAIDWNQIERQLRSLAGPDSERASWEMEVLQVSARTNPPELFFRDLLSLAWSLIDGTRPSSMMEAAME